MSVRPLFHDLAVLPFEHPMTLVGSRVARSKIWPILKINNPHEDLLQRQIWLHSIVLSLPFWTRWHVVWSSKQLRWLKSQNYFLTFWEFFFIQLVIGSGSSRNARWCLYFRQPRGGRWGLLIFYGIASTSRSSCMNSYFAFLSAIKYTFSGAF